MTDQTTPNLPAPISTSDIARLTVSTKRLSDLLQSNIVTKEGDSEKAALAQSIGNFMLDHAYEFIGAWNVLHFEYQPLIRGTAALNHRAAMLTEPSPAPKLSIVTP